jgi:hypothetical protein
MYTGDQGGEMDNGEALPYTAQGNSAWVRIHLFLNDRQFARALNAATLQVEARHTVMCHLDHEALAVHDEGELQGWMNEIRRARRASENAADGVGS